MVVGFLENDISFAEVLLPLGVALVFYAHDDCDATCEIF